MGSAVLTALVTITKTKTETETTIGIIWDMWRMEAGKPPHC